MNEHQTVKFLVPVEGLRVPRTWTIGRVIFHPGGDAPSLVGDTDDASLAPLGTVAEVLGSAAESSVAEVTAPQCDIEHVIDAVQGSLDALRLLQFERALGWPTWFGLHGDIYRSRIQYVMIGSDRSGVGGRFRGDMPGVGLSEDAYIQWHSSPGFQFLSEALADPEATEGARRATIGSTLFARAASEHRPGLRILGAISAVDAWLGALGRGPQTRRLARYVMSLSCGVERDNVCGQTRPTCPYLYLDPTVRKDNMRLTSTKALGEYDITRRCNNWHDFMAWYDLRSKIAHGKATSVPEELARQALYRISHHLAEPVLAWLGQHRDDPLGDLDAALTTLEEPPDWQSTTAVLDQITASRAQT